MPSPNVSSENAMIVPGSSISCEFMIKQIPSLDGDTGAKARQNQGSRYFSAQTIPALILLLK
jgi:hypothetical protein